MPIVRPPSAGGALRKARPVATRPRPVPSRPASSPGLRIMVAGVDKDTRWDVEASVLRALGASAEHGPWSISVVSMAGRWSVTLDGPEERLRGLSFVADGPGLADAIRDAVRGGEAPSSGAAPPGPAGSGSEASDPHVCEHCGRSFLVVYEQRPGEPRTLAAVACPHCWRIGHVEVDEWAAAGREYRAEKA